MHSIFQSETGCGLSAIYNAMGQVLKEEYGKEILPLG